MAKEYGTKLTLKDNFTAVIQKAITATAKLKEQLASAKKDLDRLGSKKVNIGAKLDSSVNASLNKLGDKIPKDKTINIKAKNDVTRTVTNMKRDIFKMGRDLEMGMRDPFKGLNSSALKAASRLSMLHSLAGNIAAGKAITGMVGTAGAASIAAGAVAGRVAGRVGKTSTIIYGGGTGGHASSHAGVPNPDYYEANQKHISLGRGDVPDIVDRKKRFVRSFDSDFADMISDQKYQMKKLFNVKNYLPQYKTGDTGGEYAVSYIDKKLGKVGYAYEVFKKKMGISGKKMELYLHFRTQEAMGRLQAFKSKLQGMKATVNGWTSSKLATEGKFWGQRTMYRLKNNSVVDFFARVKDGATAGIAKIYAKTKLLSGKTFSFTMKAITAQAEKGLSKLKSMANAVSLAVAAATGAGIYKAVTGAAQLEANAVSIKHFIKYGNQKQFSQGKAALMSDEEINSKTEAYLGGMRKYAAETPFGDTDVMSAGRRAVTVMSGNLDDATELVKIAGDMAALNPGKTIMEAMEALADLKTGEMERMKEFGLKITAEQFKGLVGKGKNDDLTEEEMNRAYKILMDKKLKTQFAGGAKKLSTTMGGKFSTLTGTATSGLADIGTMFAPGIKAALDKGIAYIEDVLPRIKTALKPIADAFNAFTKSDAFNGSFIAFGAAAAVVITALTALGAVIQLVSVPLMFLGKGLSFLLTTGRLLVSGLSMLWNAFAAVRGVMAAVNIAGLLSNPIGLAIAAVLALVAAGYLLYTYWDEIKAFFESMWDGAVEAFNWYTDYLKTVFGAVGGFLLKSGGTLLQFYSDLWNDPLNAVSNYIDNVYSTFEPLFSWLTDKWKAVCDFFTFNHPNINVSASSDSGEDGGSERAVGMNYIPYNGFKVSAHRGEAILNRVEADNWREGKTGGRGVVININDPVVREEADLDRLGTMFANKLSEVRGNMGALGFA